MEFLRCLLHLVQMTENLTKLEHGLILKLLTGNKSQCIL